MSMETPKMHRSGSYLGHVTFIGCTLPEHPSDGYMSNISILDFGILIMVDQPKCIGQLYITRDQIGNSVFKNPPNAFFMRLHSSQAFLSTIFGIFGNFRIDMSKNYFSKKF